MASNPDNLKCRICEIQKITYGEVVPLHAQYDKPILIEDVVFCDFHGIVRK